MELVEMGERCIGGVFRGSSARLARIGRSHGEVVAKKRERNSC